MLGVFWPVRHGFWDRLNKIAVAKPYMDQWKMTEKTFDFSKLQKAYDEKLKAWQEKAITARKAGKSVPGDALDLLESK